MRCIYDVELDMDGGGGEQEKDYPGVRVMEHGEGTARGSEGGASLR